MKNQVNKGLPRLKDSSESLNLAISIRPKIGANNMPPNAVDEEE